MKLGVNEQDATIRTVPKLIFNASALYLQEFAAYKTEASLTLQLTFCNHLYKLP